MVKGTVIDVSNKGINIQLDDYVYGILRTSPKFGEKQTIRLLKKIFKKSDKIEVKIIGIDNIINLVFLSISLEEIKAIAMVTNEVINNILNFIEKHPISSLVKGKIVKFSDNIVVLQLADGVQGILRKYELMRKGILSFPIFKKGDEIEVEIIGIELMVR